MGEVSGWQLAAGVNYRDGYSTPFSQARAYHWQAAELFLVLLAALGRLGVVYLASQHQITVRTAVSISLGLAALSVLIVFYEMADVSAGLANYGLEVKVRIGI
jgi:lipopolysaccharide export LptBFGC system permease protein LptF